MDNDKLILELLQELRKDVGELKINIVRQEICTRIMEKQDNRLRDVETICTRYEGLKGDISNDIQDLKNEMCVVKAEVQSLGDKSRLVDLTFKTVLDNKVLGAFAIVLGYIATFVSWGRLNDVVATYGWHSTILGILIICVAILVAWFGKRKALAAVELGKKYGILVV